MMEFFCSRGRLRPLRAGESVAQAALEAGVSAGRLMEMNPYLDPENLEEGQLICVPGEEKWARVRYGESWRELVTRHGVDEGRLGEINPHLEPRALLPGQRYRLPEGDYLDSSSHSQP